jgi:hypothetical protein
MSDFPDVRVKTILQLERELDMIYRTHGPGETRQGRARPACIAQIEPPAIFKSGCYVRLASQSHIADACRRRHHVI